jgi:SAM-dependent methyltransferase
MPSRSLPRGLLVGAGIVLAALLGVAAIGYFTGERRGPDPVPSGDFDPADFVQGRPKLDAPFVATDYEVVDAMLALAEVKPRDYVIDLGSGDGRILIAAARSHGARGLGIEIDRARIREAEANARAAHVTDRVRFQRQDLFRTPLRDADVLTLYLTQEVNLRLRDRILSQMRPGSRVVSHEFDMGDWRPDQRQRIGNANIYLWVVPARLQGRWTVTAGGNRATLDLQQSYQRLDGRVTADGSAEGTRVEQGVVNGDRVRFVADIGEGRRAFEGRVVGDRIEPLQAGGAAARSGRGAWQAVRAR